jgi:hypothetical protein
MMADKPWHVQGKIFDNGNTYLSIKVLQQIKKKLVNIISRILTTNISSL